MKIIISNNSYTPIFEQIKNTIINQILSDELTEDEPLPSIRSLAQDLRISVMTVKKAYDELENEGYIITKQGKGSFVAPKNTELSKEQKQKEIEDYILKIVDISKKYNISKDEIIETFDYIYRSEEDE
ncbi:MAG TPA: GntR family transcriptional regulator [Candidatus Faecimonas gallistercoris]|nr:GntR family transcriptional regulator [Candidatus Faecimonas gallistercoris]